MTALICLAQALSDFAEFVDKQQAMRYPRTRPDGPTTAASTAKPATEYHQELDILDTLDFDESEPQVPLRQLLLPSPEHDEPSRVKLAEHIAERLAEGHGEAMFDLGFENSGESMRLTRAEWDIALARLQEAARKQHADCNVLLTRHVGGEKESESTAGGGDGKDKEKDKGRDKNKDCTGKILIRQKPATVEDVIETRIAVVGNGESAALVSRRTPC